MVREGRLAYAGQEGSKSHAHKGRMLASTSAITWFSTSTLSSLALSAVIEYLQEHYVSPTIVGPPTVF